MRQKLLWLSEWEPSPSERGAMRAKPVRLAKKPDRVWTLSGHRDQSQPPTLPFYPTHGYDAFLDDYVHDWNWRSGVFRYYSRVANGPVWLLLEYAR